MPRTIETYTLAELRERHPEGYQAALRRIRDGIASDECPWGDDIIGSLRAAWSLFGGRARDWSIGVDSGWAQVEADDDVESDSDDDEAESSRPFALADAWPILERKGYRESDWTARDDGRRRFPGICGLTGYCADDDILEAILDSLASGETLSDALSGAAHAAHRLMAAEQEYAMSEEAILELADDRQYTAEGIEV